MNDHDCKFEERIICMIENVSAISEKINSVDTYLRSLDKRINGSFDEIGEHVRTGDMWRKMIIGIIGGFVIQIILFAYFFGVIFKTVEMNDKRLNILIASDLADKK